MTNRKGRRTRHRKAKRRAEARKLSEAMDRSLHDIAALRGMTERHNHLANQLDYIRRMLEGRVVTVLGYCTEPDYERMGMRHTFTARRFVWQGRQGLVPDNAQDLRLDKIVDDRERVLGNHNEIRQWMLRAAGSEMGVALFQDLFGTG